MSDLGDIDGLEGDELLAAEFVLGLLAASDYASVAARLQGDHAFRAHVRAWRLRLSGMDAEFAESAPPATGWQRLENRLFADAATAERSSWWNSVAVWRGFAAAALAVAVVAVGFNLSRPALTPDQIATQLVAALQQQEGSNVEFVAFYDRGSGKLKLLGLSGAEIPDKDYELWYIPLGEQPVSMGVIYASSRAEMDLAPAVRDKLVDGTVLAVTLEPKGGSPSGAPTGPIVSAGPAITI